MTEGNGWAGWPAIGIRHCIPERVVGNESVATAFDISSFLLVASRFFPFVAFLRLFFSFLAFSSPFLHLFFTFSEPFLHLSFANEGLAADGVCECCRSRPLRTHDCAATCNLQTHSVAAQISGK